MWRLRSLKSLLLRILLSGTNSIFSGILNSDRDLTEIILNVKKKDEDRENMENRNVYLSTNNSQEKAITIEWE
jgi:CRISPR/Cas system-associated endoribonuclease Cas2